MSDLIALTTQDEMVFFFYPHMELDDKNTP